MKFLNSIKLMSWTPLIKPRGPYSTFLLYIYGKIFYYINYLTILNTRIFEYFIFLCFLQWGGGGIFHVDGLLNFLLISFFLEKTFKFYKIWLLLGFLEGGGDCAFSDVKISPRKKENQKITALFHYVVSSKNSRLSLLL